MRWDARGTIALIASAIVGIAAGVVLGISTGTPGGVSADPPSGGSSGNPSTSGQPDDPLGLGVPMVNVPCTGEKIVVVGFGDQDDTGELNNAVSANLSDGVKYLDTNQSCNTLYGNAGEQDPTYAAYLGPFDTNKDPCALVMSPGHAFDTVTNLKPGINVHIPCLCVLEPATFPRLRPGMHATTKDGIYIKALQQMLVGIDAIGPKRVSGQYDEKTSTAIENLQTLNAITVFPPGKVDMTTWQLVRDRGCVNFDF